MLFVDQISYDAALVLDDLGLGTFHHHARSFNIVASLKVLQEGGVTAFLLYYGFKRTLLERFVLDALPRVDTSINLEDCRLRNCVYRLPLKLIGLDSILNRFLVSLLQT